MNLKDNPYYIEMLRKDRLIPFFKGDRLVCFITFYITDYPEKYVNRINPWSIENDDEKGNICYIDQLFTNKEAENKIISHEIWGRFRGYIRKEFPTVKTIRWNRFKNGMVKIYKKEI